MRRRAAEMARLMIWQCSTCKSVEIDIFSNSKDSLNCGNCFQCENDSMSLLKEIVIKKAKVVEIMKAIEDIVKKETD
jgi:hypothetical protein